MTVRELIVALEALAATHGDALPVYYDDLCREAQPLIAHEGWTRIRRDGLLRPYDTRGEAIVDSWGEGGEAVVAPCALFEVPDEPRARLRARLNWITLSEPKWRGRRNKARGPWWPLSRKAVNGW